MTDGMLEEKPQKAEHDFITKAISAIEATTEWHQLSQMIYSRLTEKLEENKIPYFAALNEYERSVLIDDIGLEMREQSQFQAFRRTCADKIIGELLGAPSAVTGAQNGNVIATEGAVSHAAIAAAKLLELESAVHVQNKTSLESDDGETQNHVAVSYQQSLTSLQLLLNQPIPRPLRAQVWMRILAFPEARSTFEHLVKTRRLATIASVDSEITDICQFVLDSHFDHTLSIAQRQTFLEVAKTVLSYHHTTTLSPASSLNVLDRDTCITLVHWVLPLVYGLDSQRSIPCVVEAFQSFLRLDRPRFPLHSTDGVDIERRKESARAFNELFRTHKALEKLAAHCSKLDSPEVFEGEPDLDHSLSTAATLIQPLVEQLFAGTLNMESCAFVWDQCLLAGFHSVVVPASVAVVLLLQEHLLLCDSHAAMARTIKQRARFISCDALQAVLEDHFMSGLRKKLAVPLRGASGWSLLHPAQSTGAVREAGDIVQNAEKELKNLAASDRPTLDTESVKHQLSQRLESILNEERSARERQARSKPELPPLNLLERSASKPGALHQAQSTKRPRKPATARLHDENDHIENIRQEIETKTARKVDPLEAALEAVPFDESLHRLCDTVERVHNILKASASKSSFKKEHVTEAVLAKYPKLKSFKPDYPPVLTLGSLSKKGEKVFTVCRALEPGEPASLATEMVESEISRLNIGTVSEEHVQKHVSLLLKFSRGKTKWKAGEVETAEPSKIQEAPDRSQSNAQTRLSSKAGEEAMRESDSTSGGSPKQTINAAEEFSQVLSDVLQGFATLGKEVNDETGT